MTTNPNEYYLVARERTADAMHEAEQWRQRQAIRRHDPSSPGDSAVWTGLRRLIRKLRAARGVEIRQPSGSRLSSQHG